MSLNSIKSSRILLSPLYQGLQHVSRTVPIIQTLIQHKNEVYICCNEEQESFYRDYFPELWYIPHSDYPSQIIRKGTSSPSLLSKFWSIKYQLREEQEKVAEWAAKFQPDLIISDQRLGFISKEIKSIIISHQLKSLEPRWAIFKKLWNRKRLSKFDEIWIPDTPEHKYSRKLSAGHFKNKCFLGTCSRFQNDAIDKLIPNRLRYKYMGIINNPSSCNERFMTLLLEKLSENEKDCAIIVPKEWAHFEKENPAVAIFPAPNHSLFIELMLASENIISRPDYTTIMDLVETQNKSILVPAPQQREQLYLADIHKNQPNWTFKSEELFSNMKL